MIPILVPKVPSLDSILPYLKKIDANQIYSNNGPLLQDLITRLSNHFGIDPSMMTIVANATLALEGAARTAPIITPVWECPSWTFTATPAAILNAGHRVTFSDVDEDWRINPSYVSGNLVDVLPFGEGIDVDRLELAKLTCLLIDGAASFDALSGLQFPKNLVTGVVVSMHATKVFPAGEGGIFISNDSEWVERVKRWSNFGMGSNRISTILGTNAKMSEYGAAVGLATLDNWQEIREKFRNAAIRVLEISHRLDLACFAPYPELVSSYWIIRDLDPLLKVSIEETLTLDGIATRMWWESGCHLMPAYAGEARNTIEFSNTVKAAATSIGLPFFSEISETQLLQIEKSLEKAKDLYLSKLAR